MRRGLFLLLTIVSLIFPFSLAAQSEFITDVTVTYDVNSQGITQVKHAVTLTNTLSNIYAASYTLNLQGIKPANIQAFSGEEILTTELETKDSATAIKVNFNDAVVGKGEKRQFTISFTDNSLAEKTGEVWEVAIPRLSNPETFNSYTAVVNIPFSFGERAYISPTPAREETKTNFWQFVFDKEAISQKGVVAAFGPFQVFAFDLTYHLENPLVKPGLIEIAIPPDTSFQKVFYESLDPTPSNVKIDADGNWLAVYRMKPRERLDIKALGKVQIFSEPVRAANVSEPILQTNLKESEFWQTTDPTITSLARQLKTPKAIYDYLVNNFEYDYERVRPNISRLGAAQALANPKTAICTEFTDAFVALARAAGIPAREVNGYAHTENPQIQPLSLVADVLHAWPEYWDGERRIWVPVDPTWGNTTGGIDYFNKLDLRHFTFVNHGQDPVQPYPPGSYKLGSNPQKDVFVSFSSLPETRQSQPEISLKNGRRFPFAALELVAVVKNPGPVALYNETLTANSSRGELAKTKIESLPPYSQREVSFKIPYKVIGASLPNQVTITLGETTVNLQTPRTSVIITNAALISLVLFIFAASTYLIYVKSHQSQS